jgi:hypothetical protein
LEVHRATFIIYLHLWHSITPASERALAGDPVKEKERGIIG